MFLSRLVTRAGSSVKPGGRNFHAALPEILRKIELDV
jgi:hypothetical protein